MGRRRKHPSEGIPLDYFSGIPPSERRVLQMLQKSVGKIIPRIPEVREGSFGYQVSHGHIIGLGLDDQDIEELPGSIGQLADLRMLRASHNRIWELPPSLKRLQQLELLDLRHNHLWDLPPFLHELLALETLDLVGNPGHRAKPAPKDEEEVEFGSQDYYRRYYGFDSERDKMAIPGGQRYEVWFPLENDPTLHQLGVEIGARVNFYTHLPYARARYQAPGGGTENRIVFRRERAEAEVTCVHTAIASMRYEDAMALGEGDERRVIELAQSTEGRPANLSPEEHFAALKSYVQGIAEMGLGIMMVASYHSDAVNPQTLPFGFNAQMHAQIARCLASVAPSAFEALLRDLLLEIAGNVPEKWFMSRLRLLNETYYEGRNLDQLLFADVATFEAFDEELQSSKFRLRAVKSLHTHPAVLLRLAQTRSGPVQARILARADEIEDLHHKRAILQALAVSGTPKIQAKAQVKLNNIILM